MVIPIKILSLLFIALLLFVGASSLAQQETEILILPGSGTIGKDVYRPAHPPRPEAEELLPAPIALLEELAASPEARLQFTQRIEKIESQLENLKLLNIAIIILFVIFLVGNLYLLLKIRKWKTNRNSE